MNKVLTALLLLTAAALAGCSSTPLASSLTSSSASATPIMELQAEQSETVLISTRRQMRECGDLSDVVYNKIILRHEDPNKVLEFITSVDEKMSEPAVDMIIIAKLSESKIEYISNVYQYCDYIVRQSHT